MFFLWVKMTAFLKSENVKFLPLAIFFCLYAGISYILESDFGMSTFRSGLVGFAVAGAVCLLTLRVVVPYLLRL